MRVRQYSVASLAVGGIVLMGLGVFFVFLRPPLLSEDLRSMGTSGAAIRVALPGLLPWLLRVFWVMGGFMFTSGLLTAYLALTAFRVRARWAGGVVAVAGLTSIGWMAIVNFLIGSDFKWILLACVLPWVLAVGLHWTERQRSHIEGGRPASEQAAGVGQKRGSEHGQRPSS